MLSHTTILSVVSPLHVLWLRNYLLQTLTEALFAPLNEHRTMLFHRGDRPPLSRRFAGIERRASVVGAGLELRGAECG